MPFSVNLIRKLEKVSPDIREILISVLDEIEKQREETVTKKEFLEFAKRTEENFQRVWKAINELAEAQKRTEQRVNELAEAQKRTEQRLNELAEAQKRSEERTTKLEKALAELVEAQKRTEQRVNELAEAQKKTEQRLNELAEAQKKTEQRLNELAEAQRRTEEELRALVRDHKVTRQMLAGLSDTVGYGLEDSIFPYMKEFAKREYGVEAEVLDRRNIVYPDGKYDEANIYIEGKRDGERVYIIGECKAHPGKRDIQRFVKMLSRIKKHLGENVEGFLVGYSFSPEIEDYLKRNHPEIKFFKSFEFRLKFS